MAFLQINNLSKSFGSLKALDNISLELHDDELLVILGPTGAGKTTFLRTLTGLENADNGEIIVDGEEISKFSPAQRDFSLVFQNFSLYPNWTVYENLAFPLKAPGRKMSQGEIDEKIKWAADILDITRLLERKATQLSGGEMQRVAIGRCIVRTPRLFLMDEPLTNLDAKLRESLRVELVAMRKRLKTPMIYVTHDQAEALSMGDRLIVLSEGKILQTGSPKEVYNQPATTTVARQLGQPHINLLNVTKQKGHWCNENGEQICPVEETHPEDCILGIRPEDIAVEGGKIDADILVVEDMGPNLILLVDWLGYQIHITTGKEGHIYQPHETIQPLLNLKKIHFFKD